MNENSLERSTLIFAQKEASAELMFKAAQERLGPNVKYSIGFSLPEDLGNGEFVNSPFRLRGRILDMNTDEDGHKCVVVEVLDQYFRDPTVPFEPPADYLQDEDDELFRLMRWNDLAITRVDPDHFVLRLRLGDLDGVSLHARKD